MQNQAGTLVAWKKVEPDAFEKRLGSGALPAGTNTDDHLRLIRDGARRWDLRARLIIARGPAARDFDVSVNRGQSGT